MRLRDSKLWVTGGSGGKFASGMEGILEDVEYVPASPSGRAHLNLVIKDQDKRLYCNDDINLLKSLYPKIKGCIGLPIGQILDRDF